MFDSFLEAFKRLLKSRLFPISIIYFILFCVLIHRFFVLQIIEGQQYQEESETKSEQSRLLKSTRGNIYDRNNVLLASNELSYSITYEDNGKTTDNPERNKMLYKLIEIVEENGASISIDFPISIDKKGNIVFKEEENDILRFKKDVFSLKYTSDLSEEQIAKTAEDMFLYLKSEGKNTAANFEIDSSYSPEDALKIMSIRYAMYMNRYSKYLPITVATDVDTVTVAAIKENSADLPGIEILQETHRVYEDSKYFAHMLGYTGLISSDALAEKLENEENFSATDQIGKTGLEEQYEEYLHGINGYDLVAVNEKGRVVELKKTVEPVAGNDLYLTIDSNLQKASYDLLEKKLAEILLTKINNGTSTGSKGTSAANILIPIYDVYFALIDNNVINISTLNEHDSTDLERSVYQKFLEKQKVVIQELEQQLSVHNSILPKDISEEKDDYLDYVYELLVEKGVVIKSSIDSEDKEFLAFYDDKLSLSKFLQYAISNNWVDLEKLQIGEEYYSTEEIYIKLADYAIQLLKDDSKFHKMIYQYLIETYKLSGKEICLLLFDQGVLKYKKSDIDKLSSGAISAYTFICNKIKSLEITPGQLALEPCSGSVVVTDVNTGDVLALVSYPGYDNNKLANSIDASYYSKLTNTSAVSHNAYSLMNRPLQQRTAPGSTYKMLSSIAGLEEGVILPTQTIKDFTTFTKISPSPRCWSNHSHGAVDVPHALEVSCNYFFFELGYLLSTQGRSSYNSNEGVKTLSKYAKMFGFNEKSGIELAEYDPQISSDDAVRSTIGQSNNNYTPAQLSRYVTTLANSGTSYNLTIVDKIKDLNGKVVLDNKATVLNKVDIKNSTWNLVHEGMNLVVNGSKSSITSYFSDLEEKVAGKTGTAQETTSKPNHSLFVSYAPYESPEISVTVVIPNGYTSGNAAALASDVYKYYFQEENRENLLNKDINQLNESSQQVTD